jgi:hypothetical protein
MSAFSRTLRGLALLAATIASGSAFATFHLFVVDQVFSNADGTVQYIVFLQAPPSIDEHEWKGHVLTSTHDGATQRLVYPNDLPSRLTRNKRVLVATQGFADLGLVTPDYTMPSGFLGTGAGRIVCCDDNVNFFYTALPVDGATALDGAKAPTPAVATNFAGASSPVVVAASALNPNQHGLTGSWYEPATSGQGFEVEVFPAAGAGPGFVQVSWFTYDTVSGGADRQRWYTMSGPIGGGAAAAPLTIYRNTGGNFNAAPVTTATVVGTATLRFDTCTSGTLDYAFTDGTGRTGSIPLTRLTQNVTCASGTARPTNADFAFSGNWYDAATAGQGFTIEANPVSGALFFAWYTYAPSGAAAGAAGQRWLTGSAPWTAGARSLAVQIYETTGGLFDAPSVPAPATTAAGTGTLAFQGCANASLAFNITGGAAAGKSGTIALTRVGPVPAGCAF